MLLALTAGLMLGGVPVNTIRIALPPDAAPCTVDGFGRSLRARFGSAVVIAEQRDPAAAEVQGELQVAVRQSAAGLELHVRAPTKLELVREIPGPGNDCLAASETTALIVERYLDEVGGEFQPALGPSLTPLPPPPPAMPWGVVIEASVTAELGVLPQPTPGALPSMPILGVGGFASIGVRHGRWQLSGRGTLEPAGSTIVNGSLAQGSLQIQSYAATLPLLYSLPAGPGSVRFELGPGLQLFSASTSSPNGGKFGKPGSSLSILPLIGAGVGYGLPLWKQLSALAQVGLRLRIGSVALEVDGVPSDTVYTRQLDGEASLGLGYTFY